MLAQNLRKSERTWQAAIWVTLALFAALTFWWIQPAPVPPEKVLEVPMAIPSDWVEQARVTSPDGKFDAVVVHLDRSVALQSRMGPEGQPGQTFPITDKQNAEASRVLSVRIVTKGEKVSREPAYLHRSTILSYSSPPGMATQLSNLLTDVAKVLVTPNSPRAWTVSYPRRDLQSAGFLA